MKLRASIRGSRVHEVGYRFFLFTRATELGCDRFFARNQLEKGDQIVIALIEGDQQQITEFRKFVESNRPEGSEVSDVAFEDYQGRVMSVDSLLNYFTGDQLCKGIPALLRIDRKQDRILEKLEETRSDIADELGASRDEVACKMDENPDAILEAMGDRRGSLDERLMGIENDISRLKSKVGLES